MLKFDKLDFDALHDEAEREGRIGICPLCEFAAAEDGEPVEERVLCWCGVCLKYHHDDYFHEDPIDDYPPECFGEEVTG